MSPSEKSLAQRIEEIAPQLDEQANYVVPEIAEFLRDVSRCLRSLAAEVAEVEARADKAWNEERDRKISDAYEMGKRENQQARLRAEARVEKLEGALREIAGETFTVPYSTNKAQYYANAIDAAVSIAREALRNQEGGEGE